MTVRARLACLPPSAKVCAAHAPPPLSLYTHPTTPCIFLLLFARSLSLSASGLWSQAHVAKARRRRRGRRRGRRRERARQVAPGSTCVLPCVLRAERESVDSTIKSLNLDKEALEKKLERALHDAKASPASRLLPPASRLPPPASRFLPHCLPRRLVTR